MGCSSLLEEAEGYEKLQRVHRYSLEDLAIKVAKSKGYVLARLKLLGLPEPAKKALWEGSLNPSTALLIARIPNQKLAAEATAAVLGRRSQDGPMTHVQAVRFIRGNYMLSLRGAPFPTADATLVPEAGACATCPKRTGNQKDLFGDVEKADVCTDPPCYALKKEAAWRRTCEQAEQRGHAVLAEVRAKALFGHGGSVLGREYVDLDAACENDPKRRTWRRLLGKHLPKPIHIGRDPDGRIHSLLAASDAAKALRETGHRFPVPKVPAAPQRMSDEALKQRQAQQRREAQAARAVVSEALAAVVTHVEAQEPSTAFWRLVTEALAAGSWHDTIVDTVKRRGWAAKGTRGEELLLKQAAQLGPAQLRGVVVELLVSKHAQDTFTGKVGRMLKRACDVFGVDLGRIQAKHRAAVKKGRTKPEQGKRRKT